jgi:thiamine-phosphate pyrophosphorylase
MRPLPRLLAFADDRIATLDTLGVRAAAIAASGPGVALVARYPGGSTDQLAALAARFVALAAPPGAAVLVTGRADVARATGAHGVILRAHDLAPGDVRPILAGRAAVVRSVHTFEEARAAIAAGADALVIGAIWATPTHDDRTPLGTGELARVVSLGVPTYAIGGVTIARAADAAAAGAYGVAAIRALWDAADPYRDAMEMLKPWT